MMRPVCVTECQGAHDYAGVLRVGWIDWHVCDLYKQGDEEQASLVDCVWILARLDWRYHIHLGCTSGVDLSESLLVTCAAFCS